MSTNNMVPVKSSSIPSATLAKAAGKAPAGKAGDQLGGHIQGFGGGKPDGSTVNGASAKGPGGLASPSGSLGKAQPNAGKSIQGFAQGIKPGKI